MTENFAYLFNTITLFPKFVDQKEIIFYENLFLPPTSLTLYADNNIYT